MVYIQMPDRKLSEAEQIRVFMNLCMSINSGIIHDLRFTTVYIGTFKEDYFLTAIKELRY